MARGKIGTIPKEEYYDVRQRRWVWVFPKIDRQATLERIVDLDVFCQMLFPHSAKKQGVAKAIVETFANERRPIFLRELQARVLRKIRVSSQTISDTYKAMVRSGMLEKRYRNDPTYVSRQFSGRLRDLAQYWENYLAAKKLVSAPRQVESPVKTRDRSTPGSAS